MTDRTYYEILGLTPAADGTAVNRTYWLLARKYQADAATDPRAHQMLDELNEAYTVLGTPPLREAYDATLPESQVESLPAQEDAAADRRHDKSWRRRAAGDASRPADSDRIAKLAPYAVAILFSAGSLGAGLWTADAILIALGAGAALALGAFLVRHKIAARLAVLAMTGTGPIAPAREVRERALGWSERHEDSVTDARPLAPARGVQADELRVSTASMVGRWRSAALAASHEPSDSEHVPDSTLVDIFRSEQEVEKAAEPLTAVLDVLRGSRG